MPKPERPAQAVDLPALARQIAGDGAGWARAELALARAEAAQTARRMACAVIAAGAALAVLVAASVILAQAAVAALAHVLHGPAFAGLAIGSLLLCTVAILALVSRRLLAQPAPPVSLLFKWLAG